MIAAVVSVLLSIASSGWRLPDSSVAVADTLDTEAGSDIEENLFDQIESEEEELEPLDDLVWRKEHPFDLNAITLEELESLPGVTPMESHAFIEFRRSIRRFTRVEQLKFIDDVGGDLYRKVLPYVTAGEKEETLVRFRSRTSRDLQPRRGELDDVFAGSAIKSYERLSIKGGDLEAGALFEKDSGEKISSGFTSGYALVKDVGFLRRVVVGDFAVEAGQGLVLWRGSSFGKGGAAISVARKSGLSVQPYRSSGESEFLRGGAACALLEAAGFGSIEATAFFSRNSLDATLDSSGNISGLYEGGLFRTKSELEKRKAVTERVVGGRLKIAHRGGWTVGSTAFVSTFDRTIVSDRLHEFHGRNLGVLGMDATMSLGSLSAFGEIARTNQVSFAGIAGAFFAISAQSAVVVLYRDYGPGFNNLHASGFGERSDTKNERGFYFGVDFAASKWLRFSGHIDHFRFPWQTYSNPLPTGGHEILLQSDIRVSDQFSLITRLSSKSVEGTEADVDEFGRETRAIVPRTQRKYRLTATYKASPSLTAKGRIELTTVDYPIPGRSERGYLFFQDLRYRISGFLSATTRLVFFDTDSYDSRLYEYENDVHGVFANPGLYGKGRRWYLVIDYSPSRVFSLSAKYSETLKEGVTAIGSGVTEIQGPLDNRLTVQIDLAL